MRRFGRLLFIGFPFEVGQSLGNDVQRLSQVIPDCNGRMRL
jgi:hypothetical protein